MTIQYTFTNDAGWIISEPRKFNISCAVRHTHGLDLYTSRPYVHANAMDQKDLEPSDSVTPMASVTGKPEDLVASLTRDKLKFDYLSWDVLRQLVEERVQIRDKHRKDIMGRISDVSEDISCCYNMKTPESFKSKASLEKTKLDLEKQAREEDISLWKDVADLRKELLAGQRQYQSTRMRQDLVSNLSLNNGN